MSGNIAALHISHPGQPVDKGLLYKDSQFLLMTNTVKVPWYLVSYQVLLPGKERGQDLNADIKMI